MSRSLPPIPDLVTTPSTVGLVDRISFPEFAEIPIEEEQPTPQPPSIQARLGLRILAKLIDGAIAGFLYCLCTFLIEDWFTGFLFGGTLGAIYFLLSDAVATHGRSRRSLGKQVVGLSLARLDRRPVDWRTSAQRNWMLVGPFFVQAFTFDAPALSWLLLLVAVAAVGRELYGAASNVYGCRWGDEIAGTEVLERAPSRTPQQSAEPLRPSAAHRYPR